MTSTGHGREEEQEMSMDEILASIRRYVSPDEPIERQTIEPSFIPQHRYAATDDVIRLVSDDESSRYSTPSQHMHESKHVNDAFEPDADALLSSNGLHAASQSFAKLKEATLPKQEHHSGHNDMLSGLNHPTLDQLFASLARPMVRDWLDKHLPSMVEHMVAKEIERITHAMRR